LKAISDEFQNPISHTNWKHPDNCIYLIIHFCKKIQNSKYFYRLQCLGITCSNIKTRFLQTNHTIVLTEEYIISSSGLECKILSYDCFHFFIITLFISKLVLKSLEGSYSFTTIVFRMKYKFILWMIDFFRKVSKITLNLDCLDPSRPMRWQCVSFQIFHCKFGPLGYWEKIQFS